VSVVKCFKLKSRSSMFVVKYLVPFQMYYLLRAMVSSVSLARNLVAAYQTNVSILLRRKKKIEELSYLGRAINLLSPE